MKPFDLEAAKRGEPIQCRNGTSVKFIAHIPEAHSAFRVIVLNPNGVVSIRNEHGRLEHVDNPLDLMMVPKKTTYWVNIYKCGGSLALSGVHTSEEAAKQGTFEYGRVYPERPFVKRISFEVEE